MLPSSLLPREFDPKIPIAQLPRIAAHVEVNRGNVVSGTFVRPMLDGHPVEVHAAVVVAEAVVPDGEAVQQPIVDDPVLCRAEQPARRLLQLIEVGRVAGRHAVATGR